jgi:hypothetical protein
MITYTGRRFWPLDPRPEDVSFRDVAHALSNVCRYGGHARHFYSVAEHSRLLAEFFEGQRRRDAARFALLHDASEAYIGDMVRPLKGHMLAFSQAESLVQDAIFTAAGLEGDIPAAVHQADTAILVNEARLLFGAETLRQAGWTWVLERPPLRAIKLVTDDPLDAEHKFTQAFARLFPDVAFA